MTIMYNCDHFGKNNSRNDRFYEFSYQFVLHGKLGTTYRGMTNKYHLCENCKPIIDTLLREKL